MPCPFPHTARVGTGLALLLSSLSPCSQAAEASPYASTIALPSPSPSPAPKSTPLEDLVVVGEKLGRTQQNTATSTAVLTEADLRARGEPAVRNLLEELVNVSLAEEGGLSIRGIAQDGAGSPSGSELISVQVDGVTLDGTSQESALENTFDMERVEVLRGAQSTSQGRNALGGAVVLRSREPDFINETRLYAAYGERNSWQLGAVQGGPVSQSLAYRLTASQQETDGFITHQPEGDERFAFTRRRLLRGQLLYAPMVASEWRSRLVLSATDYAGQPDYNMERGTAGEDFRRTSYANAPSEDVVETLLLSWENTLRLSPSLGLTSITALMDSRQAYLRDFDGLEEEGGTNPATADGQNLSQELRLDWEPSGTLHGIVGLYGGRFDDAYVYSSEDIRVPASYFAPLPLPLAAALIEVRTDFYSEQFNEAVNGAVFAEFDWDWRPWLSLTFGLRYDRETLDARNRNETTRADAYLASPSGVQQLPLAGDVLGAILEVQPGIDILTLANATGIAPQTDGLQGGETTYEALLPKLGLRLALSKNWMTFATYSEAYRAGGVSVDGSSGEVYPYDPEYTVNGEIGLRGKMLAGALESSLNLFYTDWTDQQVPVLQNQFYIVQNAGKSRLYGAEASLRWRPSPRWKGDLGLGYVDTQFLEYEDGDNSYRGNDFPLAPPVSASIGGQWMHPQGWEVGLRFSYQDHAFTRPSNREDEYSESRRLLSARMGWQGQHWAVFLSGSNLLNEDYATETFQFPEGYVGADGARGYGAYGAPRTLSLSLEWQL